MIKYKMFTILNIIGLSLGLSGFMLISAYIIDEISYDNFHKKADQIVRIDSHIHIGENKMDLARTSDVMGPILKDTYSEIEEFARLYTSGGAKLIKNRDKWINEASVAHADSTFFRIFTYTSIQGDLTQALTAPNTVVLSRTAAKRYFNSVDIVGKTLETQDKKSPNYQITAVIEDMLLNGHFRYDFIFSMENAPYGNWGNPLSHNFTTYLLLNKSADRSLLQSHLEEYILNHCLPVAREYLNVSSMETFRRHGNIFDYEITPIKDIHLHSNLNGELGANGNIQYIYIFGIISIFILLIACVNFVNLSTARSVHRAKDVGIHKILGSSRNSLAGKFLIESLLLALISIIIACAFIFLALPLFNGLSSKIFLFSDIINVKSFPLIILLSVFVGLIAGYYPAIYLSSFKPLQTLNFQTAASSRKSIFRNGLVIFQFTISIVLIISTFTITSQLQYIQNKKLGYERENIVLINDYYALGNQAKAFRDEILNIPGVLMGTVSGYLPVSQSNRNDNPYSHETVQSTSNTVQMQSWDVDEHYLSTFNLELITGRNFSPSRPADSNAVILNETAVKHFGFRDDAIGKQVHFQFGDDLHSYNVVGVVKDFNFESLREPVSPLGLFLGYNPSKAAFKVETDDLPLLLRRIEDTWEKFAPGFAFNYRFLDEYFDQMYRSEQRINGLIITFATMATVIACLGLFGLAAFMAEQRSKEIGIRKVLGSSVFGIVTMLCKDFVKLVVLAILIASPISWWAMNNWLQGFAYRIELHWGLFILTASVAITIALMTVSTQAVKAARANPVDSLRDE